MNNFIVWHTFHLSPQSLANQVESLQLEKGCLYPPLKDIRDVSFKIAVDVVKLAYTCGLATIHPEPENKQQLVQENLYSADYMSYIPHTYNWPTEWLNIETTPKQLENKIWIFFFSLNGIV